MGIEHDQEYSKKNVIQEGVIYRCSTEFFFFFDIFQNVFFTEHVITSVLFFK